MPHRTSANGPSFRGKARYKHKPYYPKPKATTSSEHQQHDTSSHPNTPRKRIRRVSRSLSDQVEQRSPRVKHPPPARSKKQQSVLSAGLFGAERDRAHVNINILRQSDKDKPKGNIPAWLSDTYKHLPSNHPLRKETANLSNNHPTTFHDDDSNPFAFQPPSPVQSPNVDGFDSWAPVLPLRAPAPRFSVRRTGLSSIAPTIIAEPLYQENYQDINMPLNDFIGDSGVLYPAHGMQTASPTISPVSQAFNPHQPSTSPDIISSPLFASAFGLISSPVPQLSPTAHIPPAYPFSSDDTMPHTPNSQHATPLEQDEIQDALRVQHPYFASVYATSPMLGRLPSNTFVDTSPSFRPTMYQQTPSPFLGPTWADSSRLAAHTSYQSHPPSMDIYKDRLLAYATAAADQLSSSDRDETLARRRLGGAVTFNDMDDDPDEGTSVQDSDPGNSGSGFIQRGVFKNPTRDLVHEEELPQSPPGADLLFSPNAIRRPDMVAEASLEAGTKVPPDSDNFNSVDDEYFKNELDGEFSEDGFEHGNTAVSEHEDMQAEEDELARDEPPDEVEDQETSNPLQDNTTGTEAKTNATEVPEHKPNISTFPMSIPRTMSPDSTAEKLTKLSPKFVSRSVRRTRPSPFASLLKSRREPTSGAETTPNQIEREDEIESWPG